MSNAGHIIAVELDLDGFRLWTTFDCTTPEGDAEATLYIEHAAEEGELSDIDCTTQCPCKPVQKCEHLHTTRHSAEPDLGISIPYYECNDCLLNSTDVFVTWDGDEEIVWPDWS